MQSMMIPPLVLIREVRDAAEHAVLGRPSTLTAMLHGHMPRDRADGPGTMPHGAGPGRSGECRSSCGGRR